MFCFTFFEYAPYYLQAFSSEYKFTKLIEEISPYL